MKKLTNKIKRSNLRRKEQVKDKKNKNKQTDKSILIGVSLIVLLLMLIGVSIMSFTELDKNSSEIKTVNKESNNTVNNKKKNSNSIIKNINVNNLKNQDIVSLIKLILLDYEISNSSIKEHIINSSKGERNIYFNIKSDTKTIKEVTETLIIILKKRGYKVSKLDKKLAALGNNEKLDIVFMETDSEKIISLSNKELEKDNNNKIILPIPPAKSDVLVRMAILLDDGGANLKLVERFVKLKYPVGIAILPHLKYSKESASLAVSYKKTLFLHFPMEPKSYPDTDPGEGAALVNMPELLIDGVAKSNFASLGVPVDGVNNHMGSKLTEDPTKMSQIMNIIKNYTDTFIDSRTTPNSVAYNECIKAGLKCGMNKKFIDNDNDINMIIKKIYEGAELAKKGDILMIGHIRKNTIEALEVVLPILAERNYVVVPINTLVR